MADANIRAVITAEDKASQIIKSFGDGASDTLKKVGLAVGAVGVGLTAFAKTSTDAFSDLYKNSKDLSRQTGLNITQSSELLYVLNRMGVSVEQASTTFGIFSRNINSAAKGSDEAKKTFENLGVNVLDANGKTRDFNSLLLETADKFKGMKDGSEKTALAMQLFGRSGKDLLPVLDLGAQGIKNLEDEADKLGLTLTAKNIGAVRQYIASQKDLKDSTQALKIQVGELTSPVMTSLNNKISEVTQSFVQSQGPMKTVAANVLAFGGPVLTAAGAASTFAGNIASIGKESLIAGARFGAIGLAIGAAIYQITTTGKAVYDAATNQTSWNYALETGASKLGGIVPAFGPLITALGTIGLITDSASQAQGRLSAAHDATAAAMQRAKSASDVLANAELAKQGADLQAEQAQKNYNNAVAQFGPNSLEARQAAYDLEVAHQNQKTAVDNANKAVKDKSAADSVVAKNKDLENHLRDGQGSADGQRGAINNLINKIKDFNAVDVAKKIFDFNVNVDKALLHKLHVPGFASGVTNFGGGLAIVGEQGPELAYLPQGTNIIPNNKIDASPPNTSASSQPINVTFSGIFTGNQQEFRKLAVEAFKSASDAAAMKGYDMTSMTTDEWRRL